MTGDAGLGREGSTSTASPRRARRFAAVIGSPGRARPVASCPTRRSRATCPCASWWTCRRTAMRVALRADRVRGQRRGPRQGQGHLRPRSSRSARRSTRRTSPTTARLQERTVRVETPDERLDTAFAWAKVGIDKGLADEPAAGHRPRGGLPHLGRERAARVRLDLRPRRAVDRAGHPRPYGDFGRPRARRSSSCAKFQRADGKIPHEISQSASLVPWFTRLRVPVGRRGRDAALRDRAGGPLARHAATARYLRRALGLDREGLALLRGDRHATATA